MQKSEVKNNYFCLRYPPYVSISQRFMNTLSNNSTVKAVIIGPCGSGKTSLMNILCGTSYQAKQQSNSSTRAIQLDYCQYDYKKPFIIIDTPGSTSMQNKYMHAAYIRNALTNQELNTIFILVKFENRYEIIFKSLVMQSKMAQKYKEKIVYVITHFDYAEDPTMFRQQFDRYLTSKKIVNQVIYLSSKSYDKKNICDTFYNIGQGMTQHRLYISKIQFYKNFNIKLSEEEMEVMGDETKQYIDEMREIAQQYINLAKSLEKNNEKEAIVQDMAVQLKQQLKKQVNLFTDQISQLAQTECVHQFYYTINAEVQSLDQMFQNSVLAQRGLTGGLIQHTATGGLTDIRDLIKQCPNHQCRLIWMRIQKCPNTHCGTRPSCFFDIFSSSKFRYKTQRKHGKLMIIKQQFQNKKQNVTNENKGKHVGCGQVMHFQLLPRLQNIDSVLMEWYKVTTMEEVIARFQGDQQLEETRIRIESEVNSSTKTSCLQLETKTKTKA